LKAEEKELRAQLRSSTASTSASNSHHNRNSTQILSIPDLHVVTGKLEQDKVDLENRLRKLNEAANGEGPPPVMGVQEREKIVEEWKSWQKISRVRRKIREELWYEVREIVGRGKEADVKEELGLEF
jgi:26S proteasome regulatory subunit (ATPase 3-interacting protein)